MKKVVFFMMLLFAAIPLFADNGQQAIQLHPRNIGHSGLPLYPADQPSVYYDMYEDEIIVYGSGEASYYDVEIISMSTLDVMLSTCINGTFDTIDVSSLPDDCYQIVLTSSLNNIFEGYFYNY